MRRFYKWSGKIVNPKKVLSEIRPGMSVFLGTGVAEPRTLVQRLLASTDDNIQDLELIQLVSLGDAIANEKLNDGRFRLKTFFSGWVAHDAITRGHVDLIPARFSKVPALIEAGKIRTDVAFVQITPPDDAGYASLGVSVDVARQAMANARLVVGEIQPEMPRTFGDTFVHVDDFHYLVEATESLLLFPRVEVEDVYDSLAENVASLVDDGSCLAWSMERLFEALWPHLARKKDLGIHTPFFTDSLMDLVKSGAVTNRKKGSFKGKCVTSYALGTRELMDWLDSHPLVEFQGVDVLGDPDRIHRNSKTVAILPIRRVDLTGQIAFLEGRGNLGVGPSVANEFISGASMSSGGRVVAALPSRNRDKNSNIVLNLGDLPNQYNNPESIDLVVTEYGTANLAGRTVRERALALIDIAHPDDREGLVEQAKERNILFKDQIYLIDAGRLYPYDLAETATLKDNLVMRFRPIRPSDEEEMRRLFYRFSSEAVYYRYFSPIKTMPHAKMQEYVNVDYKKAMSIVGLVGDPGQGHIIAEGRWVKLADRPWADTAFVVDEEYQGKGIATHLLLMLIRIALDRGIEGFTADVLSSNKAIKVYEKAHFPVSAKLESGVYHIEIDFTEGGKERAEGLRTLSARKR
jgi:acyl-CoA hydrolase